MNNGWGRGGVEGGSDDMLDCLEGNFASNVDMMLTSKSPPVQSFKSNTKKNLNNTIVEHNKTNQFTSFNFPTRKK